MIQPIVGKKISGELVYFNGGSGAKVLLNKTEGKEPLKLLVNLGEACAFGEELTITGKSAWQAGPFKLFAEQMLFQSCNTSMCLYNENGTGTVREARLYLGKVGSSIEVTLETEDRVVLAPNTEKFKEFTIE